MYERHFGFQEPPFSINPDPRFLYLSETHQEALAHLIYGVEAGKGFIVITGEVGTGKTTLLRKLLENIGEKTRPVLISNPRLTLDDFFVAISLALGLEDFQGSKAKFLSALERHLQEIRSRGCRVTLIIDEAQGLPPELLEEVRLLSNLETGAEKLVQIVLVGQQELNDKLMSYDLRQLRQRISLKFHISPLSAIGTAEYINHRLSVAGYIGPEIFSPKAVKEIFAYSRGYPRVINILCDMALLTAFSKGSHQVSRTTVRESINDIVASYPVSGFRTGRAAAQFGRGRRNLLLALTLALIILLICGSTALWYLTS